MDTEVCLITIKNEVGMKRGGSTTNSSTDNQKVDVMWKGLLKANVFNKVKVFVWRVYRDIIPTMVNLNKRQVTMEASCLLCGKVPETILPILRHRKIERDNWKQLWKDNKCYMEKGVIGKWTDQRNNEGMGNRK